MEKDPLLKIRLQIARERIDTFLEQEVEQGDRGAEGFGGQARAEAATSDPVRQDDDQIPEVGEHDGELVQEDVRPRADSRGGASEPGADRSMANDSPAEPDVDSRRAEPAGGRDEEDEPNEKRTRTATLSVERRKPVAKVSWADLLEEEEAERHLRSVEGSPPSTDDDRRVGPADSDDHKQGGPTKSKPISAKEGRRGLYDVCEVFSPPRISFAAERLGLRGGWSLDLSQPCRVTGKTWDCRKEEDRDWARRRVRQDRPELLILCPSCTLFSSLQNLSPNGLPEKRCPEKWDEAIMMVNFAVELAMMQHKAGRAFIFEHPSTASSRI